MGDDRRRVRLTEAEWEAELKRARGVQAVDVERYVLRPPTVRRRRWFMRPWGKR